MIFHRASHWMLAVVLVCLATGLTGTAFATEAETSAGVPMPDIPPGQGQACVEDTDYMRRNHMDMLKHQRDETMLRGLRVEQYSLKACIDCHVVTGTDSKPITVANPRHFCRSCHDYAAVNIDCFQCHASRPESGVQQFSGVFPTTATVNGSK